MNFLLFSLLTVAFCRPHFEAKLEKPLQRRTRDLLYWNRMYNQLQTTPTQTRSSRVICQTLRHLYKTSNQQKRLKNTMISKGCMRRR